MKHLYDQFKREGFAAIIDSGKPLDDKFDLLTASYNKWLDLHIPKDLHGSADDLLWDVTAESYAENWAANGSLDEGMVILPDVQYQALHDFCEAWEYLEERRHGPRTTLDDSAQVEWRNCRFNGNPIYRD